MQSSNGGGSATSPAKQSSSGGCCGGSKKQNKNDKAQLRLSRKADPTADVFGSASGSNKPKYFEAKVILLGDSGVGKSSIAQRYCKDIFTESHDVTIGGAYL